MISGGSEEPGADRDVPVMEEEGLAAPEDDVELDLPAIAAGSREEVLDAEVEEI